MTRIALVLVLLFTAHCATAQLSMPSTRGSPRIMQGPQLGAGESADESSWRESDTVTATMESGYTVGVDFFFLDGRHHREPPELADAPAKTQPRKRQLEGLLGELRSSRAAFKLLVSGTGRTGLQGPDSDSWAGYLIERQRLLDVIRDERITGVVPISGDRDRGEVNVVRRSQLRNCQGIWRESRESR